MFIHGYFTAEAVLQNREPYLEAFWKYVALNPTALSSMPMVASGVIQITPSANLPMVVWVERLLL